MAVKEYSIFSRSPELELHPLVSHSGHLFLSEVWKDLNPLQTCWHSMYLVVRLFFWSFELYEVTVLFLFLYIYICVCGTWKNVIQGPFNEVTPPVNKSAYLHIHKCYANMTIEHIYRIDISGDYQQYSYPVQ